MTMHEVNKVLSISAFLFFFLISSSEATCEGANDPWVLLTNGCVEGLRRTSVLGRSIFSFQGIPYAAPPVGNLRFRAPKPVANWSGVLKAVEESPACIQPWRETSHPITYSEDCLYLNVFTPYLKHPGGKLMPVIVWIHGGKYFQGSSSSYKYGADFLLDKDVVVVTINYRLGVFGYLNMNIPEAQGNAAMKDKVIALKWIQKEIAKFGGDPKSVTITGGSSGAADVNYLYISPMAKGLFHKAISNSGSALCAWAFLPSTAYLGEWLAMTVGCPLNNAQNIVSCLRSMNSTDLAEKQMNLENVEGLENPFVPSIERDLGEEVFLFDSPQNLILKATGVPYIMGITNGEGLMSVNSPKSDPNQFVNLEKDLISYLPVHFWKNGNIQTLQKFTTKINEFYIGKAPFLRDTMTGFVDFVTDRQFGFCTLETVRIMSTQAPVYLYYFTFEGYFQQMNHAYRLWNLSGICHGEELGYIFYRNTSVQAHNALSAYPREVAMVKNMVNLWTNFATYGNPTPTHSDMNISWQPAKGMLTNHLIIGNTLKMAPYPLLKKRTDFWKSMYTLLNPTQTSFVQKYAFPLGTVDTIFLIISFLLLGIIFLFIIRRNGYTIVR